MAGADKTTAAEHLVSQQHNAFVIEGDVARRYISKDLGIGGVQIGLILKN